MRLFSHSKFRTVKLPDVAGIPEDPNEAVSRYFPVGSFGSCQQSFRASAYETVGAVVRAMIVPSGSETYKATLRMVLTALEGRAAAKSISAASFPEDG